MYLSTQTSQGRKPLAPWILALLVSITPTQAASDTHLQNSYWYDWAWYGGYPRTSYESFGADSPMVNVVKQDARCDESYTFFAPRGKFVETPAPVIIDNDGNLIWTQTKWGQAMDLRVQKFQNKDYITFWRGSDSGTFGSGSFYMLNQSYDVFKEVKPVGNLPGDLHEFHITEKDTALMTIYQKTEADMSGYGIGQGWVFDSLFQEVDLVTGELIFEWHASQHYAVDESLEPRNGRGESSNNAFDFFHINSVDKDPNGDYIISSRYMCAVICVSHLDGSVLWQLGGKSNSFKDLSGGHATDMKWNHHASWYENNTLTIFDNRSNGRQDTSSKSRGLLIDLNMNSMTATLVRAFFAPTELLAVSQGSMQVLPNGNVLVGWGHSPAFTEYTMAGEVLCDTHFGALRFGRLGWAKSYRTFKFPWIGRPNTLPDVAMRPKKNALYVSWNGATEVQEWRLQSSSSDDDDAEYFDHYTVNKKKFETELTIPGDSNKFVRAAALDKNGEILAYSRPVSTYETTIVELLEAPWRGWIPQPLSILVFSIAAFFGLLSVVTRFRSSMRRSVNGLLRKGLRSYKYQPLPSQ